MKNIQKRNDDGGRTAPWRFAGTEPGMSPGHPLEPQPNVSSVPQPASWGRSRWRKELDGGLHVGVSKLADIVTARQCGRQLSVECGFSGADSTIIATIVSELARNIVLYAKEGEIIIVATQQGDSRGITIVGRDDGPGILHLERALMGGYSTSGGLGLGLYGVKQISDEFDVETGAGQGTVVMARKWRH